MKIVKDLGLIYPTSGSNKKYYYGIYMCSCGSLTRALMKSKITKETDTKQCMSCRNKAIGARGIKHNGSRTKLYKVWTGIKQRCTNTNNSRYLDYGGRGIGFCSEWVNFINFQEWSNNNGYKNGLTIDRINNNKGYSPDNCRWTGVDVQSTNKRKRMGCSSKYIGVSFAGNKWLAMVTFKGSQKYIGSYATEDNAARARDAYILTNSLPHLLTFKYFNKANVDGIAAW